MIDTFDDLETARKLRNSIIVKIGVHYGLCIAVTFNEKLDYFRTAVKIAARVQGLSDGRDVMISDSKQKWNGEPFTTSLERPEVQLHRSQAHTAEGVNAEGPGLTSPAPAAP
jgi:class 3 adenylate cyclase